MGKGLRKRRWGEIYWQADRQGAYILEQEEKSGRNIWGALHTLTVRSLSLPLYFAQDSFFFDA